MAWVAGIGSLAVAISAVAVLNALFAFVQERRADRAADRLCVLLPSEVRVRRDGHVIAIDASEVVVDDVVLLEAGDRDPADAEVVATESVLVDTSLLTGESEAVPAVVGDKVFAGTFVVESDAAVVVTSTGSTTRLASIASLAVGERDQPERRRRGRRGCVRCRLVAAATKLSGEVSDGAPGWANPASVYCEEQGVGIHEPP